MGYPPLANLDRGTFTKCTIAVDYMQAPRSREIERQETEKWKEKRKHKRRIGNFFTCIAQIMRDIFVLDLFFWRTPRTPFARIIPPHSSSVHRALPRRRRPPPQRRAPNFGTRLPHPRTPISPRALVVPPRTCTRQVQSRDGRTTPPPPLLAWLWLLLPFPSTIHYTHRDGSRCLELGPLPSHQFMPISQTRAASITSTPLAYRQSRENKMAITME